MKQPTTSLDPSLQQSEAILLTSCDFPRILFNLILSLFIYQALLIGVYFSSDISALSSKITICPSWSRIELKNSNGSFQKPFFSFGRWILPILVNPKLLLYRKLLCKKLRLRWLKIKNFQGCTFLRKFSYTLSENP